MANPILNQNRFEQDIDYIETMTFAGGEAMTIDGTLQVTGFIGILVLASAIYTWTRFTLGYTDLVTMLAGGGLIVGFILALIISFCRFSPQLTKIRYLVPVYAICEGLFLGGFSAVTEKYYPGIVSMAIAGTFAALFSMLILYKARVINCTRKFRSILFIAMLSIAGVYLINLIGNFFGRTVPVLYSTSPIGILVSVVIVVIAAFNLILDFNFIEQGAERGFPKEYEWFGAFGLLVTLVWLYMEILRLLVKIQGSRR